MFVCKDSQLMVKLAAGAREMGEPYNLVRDH